jgi:hypothetical protein
VGHGLHSKGNVTLLQEPQEFIQLSGSLGVLAGALLLVMHWYIIIIIVQNMKRVTT